MNINYSDYQIKKILLEDIDIKTRFDRDIEQELNINILADDIQKNGMHTEIWIYCSDYKMYTLISGKRRVDAHKLLGLKSIMAKVFTISDEAEIALMMINENSNRINYNYFEKIDNFIHLVRLSHSNTGRNYNNFYYSKAIRIAARSLENKEKLDSDGRTQSKDQPKDEIKFELIVKDVLERTSLFEDYDKLIRAMQSDDISTELKKFAYENSIAMKGLKFLETAEKSLSNLTIDIKHNVKELASVNTRVKHILSLIDRIFDELDQLHSSNKEIEFIENIKNNIDNDLTIFFNFETDEKIRKEIKTKLILIIKTIEETFDGDQEYKIRELCTYMKNTINMQKFGSSRIFECILDDLSSSKKITVKSIQETIKKYKKLKEGILVIEDESLTNQFKDTFNATLEHLKNNNYPENKQKKLENLMLKYIKNFTKLNEE